MSPGPLPTHAEVGGDGRHPIWPSIIFPIGYLRAMLCSCQINLLRSGALSLFRAGNRLTVSRLHYGKEKGILYFPDSHPLPLHLWTQSRNQPPPCSPGQESCLRGSFSLLKIHSPKHCRSILDFSLCPCGFTLAEIKVRNMPFFSVMFYFIPPVMR